MKSRWGLCLAVLLFFGITLLLGRWQLQRAAQKEALQAAMDAQTLAPALDNATLLQSTDSVALVHRTAHLRGQWVPGATVFLDNRQMDGKVGFFVVSALQLEGSSRVVAVERGWAPRNFLQREALPPVQTPLGWVEIQGRIALPPSQLYAPGAASDGVIRQNLDMAAWSAQWQLSLLPVTLQQTGTASEGLLRDWPAVNLGVGKHYGYAAQWFAMAALIAGLTLWFQVIRRFFLPRKDVGSHVE